MRRGSSRCPGCAASEAHPLPVLVLAHVGAAAAPQLRSIIHSCMSR